MQTQHAPNGATTATAPRDDIEVIPDQPAKGFGWIFFAGVMLLIVGVLQAISGFVALFNDTYYVVGARTRGQH